MQNLIGKHENQNEFRSQRIGIFQKGTLKLVFLSRIGAYLPVLDIRSQEGTVVQVLFGQDRSIVFHESCGESREKWTRHDG